MCRRSREKHSQADQWSQCSSAQIGARQEEGICLPDQIPDGERGTRPQAIREQSPQLNASAALSQSCEKGNLRSWERFIPL
jgi:hypothetical protein